MTYLLDTNILSETRKRQPAAGVTSWIASTPPERLHVSVLTLGEIEQGISRIRGRGDNEQAAGLERWLREVELGFADRILPITLPVATAWGRQQHAQSLPVVDRLIAATAKVNSLTVVTRNAKDFERTGVQVLNPFRD
ncbi:MAG TPA: type II toxin-antitoxin system VapC family toxin [Streptosporangiaceae bacterium]|nr:type II toxin-antitoxin system VapC family toxin [Streptosporangiaceae bacterium]